MTESLLETFGIYGGSAAVGFIAGIFPPFSIEVFLIGVGAIAGPTFPVITVCCLCAAVGHQLAKTLTYYAGVGTMERGRLKQKIEKIRPRIDRWNKAPHFVLFLAGAFGIPPLWPIGFIARPLMRIQIIQFTVIVFVTRFGRFVVLMAAPALFD